MADAHRDYAATPLWRKLGIREGSRVLLTGQVPLDLSLGSLPREVEMLRRAGPDLDVVVLFATSMARIEGRFPGLAGRLVPDGRLWVAWPKKASKVATDVTFELAQALGLEAGLVDNKSASINDVYQGLQFVVRLLDRPGRERR